MKKIIIITILLASQVQANTIIITSLNPKVQEINPKNTSNKITNTAKTLTPNHVNNEVFKSQTTNQINHTNLCEEKKDLKKVIPKCSK